MLGPVHKYNIPYKMASEDIQNKAQMVKKQQISEESSRAIIWN